MYRLIFLSVRTWFATLMVLIITSNASVANPGTVYDFKRVNCESNLSVDVNEKTEVTNHKISIELFPVEHTFRAKDEMLVKNQGEFISLNLNKGFKIKSAKLDGKETKFQFDRAVYKNKLKKLDDDNVASDFSRAGVVKIDTERTGEHVLILDYEGSLYEAPSASLWKIQLSTFSRRDQRCQRDLGS